MKRSVLIITDVFPRWEGDNTAPDYILDLAVGLSKNFQVYVLAPHSYCSAKMEKIQGINIVRFQYFFSKWQKLSSGDGVAENLKSGFLCKLQLPFFIIAEIFALINLLYKSNIDVINTHNVFPHAFVAGLVKKFFKKPHILTIHDSTGLMCIKEGFLAKTLGRRLAFNTDIMLPVSIYLRYFVEKIVQGKFRCEIIPMGVDLERFSFSKDKSKLIKSLDIPKNSKIFLYAGKLLEKNGIDILLRAVSVLKNDFDNFIVVIIGDGPLEDYVKNFIKSENIEKYFRFLGLVDKDSVPRYYAISDASIHPLVPDKYGYIDGMPLSVIESLASGTPVIASNTSGLTDIIKDERDGWLFEAGNYHDLCSKMKKVINLNDLTSIRDNALETAKLYDAHSVSNRYCQLVSSLIPQKK